jgi:predicted nucleic acid-binding protein
VSDFVVDASVAVKWFLPEIHATAALRLIHQDNALLVPDLLFSEIGNVLLKRVQRGQATIGAAGAVLGALAAVPLQVHPSQALVPLAFEIACRSRRSVYDSTYLAVAVLRHCPLVTADRRLYDSLQAGSFAPLVVWIEDATPGP